MAGKAKKKSSAKTSIKVEKTDADLMAEYEIEGVELTAQEAAGRASLMARGFESNEWLHGPEFMLPDTGDAAIAEHEAFQEDVRKHYAFAITHPGASPEAFVRHFGSEEIWRGMGLRARLAINILLETARLLHVSVVEEEQRVALALKNARETERGLLIKAKNAERLEERKKGGPAAQARMKKHAAQRARNRVKNEKAAAKKKAVKA